MRTSRVRAKLAANQSALCTKMNTGDPMIADMIGLCGFDCIWLCQEHGPYDWDRLGHLIRAAAVHNVDTMVRVAKGSYSDWVRPLELGATGLMVPHCMNADEARYIVRNTRFHPIGRRPIDGGNYDGEYCFLPVTDYIRRANEETFLAVQIEDPEALPHIEEICAVPGVDIVYVGPGDLAHALGAPGDMSHPAIADTINRVAAACKANGKHWGTPMSPASAPRLMELGARFLTSGADVIGLGQYFSNLRAEYRKLGV